jgi:hypothetical protein
LCSSCLWANSRPCVAIRVPRDSSRMVRQEGPGIGALSGTSPAGAPVRPRARASERASERANPPTEGSRPSKEQGLAILGPISLRWRRRNAREPQHRTARPTFAVYYCMIRPPVSALLPRLAHGGNLRDSEERSGQQGPSCVGLALTMWFANSCLCNETGFEPGSVLGIAPRVALNSHERHDRPALRWAIRWYVRPRAGTEILFPTNGFEPVQNLPQWILTTTRRARSTAAPILRIILPIPSVAAANPASLSACFVCFVFQ